MFQKIYNLKRFRQSQKPDTPRKQQEIVKTYPELNDMVEVLCERGLNEVEIAAHALAEGFNYKQTAAAAGISPRTLYRWRQDDDFKELLDTVTVTTGLAAKAARVRKAKQVIRRLEDWREEHEQPMSSKDILDWMKYLQNEMEGLRLFTDEQIEQFANMLINHNNDQSE